MYDPKMWCGPNDGGIKRGDRADTGDEEARPNDTVTREGSGFLRGNQSNSTADPSSLGAADGVSTGSSYDQYDTLGSPDPEPTSGANIDDLTVHTADDGVLGLTGLDDKPEEDWVADSGPTRTPEEFDRGAGRR